MAKKKPHSNLRQVAKRQEKQALSGDDKEAVILTAIEKQALSVSNSEEEESEAYIALKYYDHEHQCFSEWTEAELKAFSEFNNKVRSQTWRDIYRSGGRSGDKVGLGHTKLGSDVISKLPHSSRLKKISQDISFFELRVTKRARAIGFRVKAIFFLVWLDREHDACGS